MPKRRMFRLLELLRTPRILFPKVFPCLCANQKSNKKSMKKGLKKSQRREWSSKKLLDHVVIDANGLID
jgi:hypothetical protein